MTETTHRPYRYPDHLQAIKKWMEAYRKSHGYPPNHREVAAAFPTDAGLPRSTVVVRYWYARMQDAGMIRCHPGIARGVEILK
jgi:hypothetical protein